MVKNDKINHKNWDEINSPFEVEGKFPGGCSHTGRKGECRMSSYLYEVVKTEPDVPVKCFYYWDPVGNPVAAHWHNSVEIIRIDRGRMTVDIGSRHIFLEAECFLIINSREIHATFSERNTQVEVLQLPFPFLKKYIPDMEKRRFYKDAVREQEKPQNREVGQLLHEMCEATRKRKENYLLEFHRLLFMLLDLLERRFCEETDMEQQVQEDRNRRRLTRVMDYVNQHYREKLTLEEVAEVVALNREYFCRFFKRYMGMSLMDYVNEVRFSHVCRDLFETEESILLLLEEHGFTNYKLFMKMFKERYQKTPRDVRRECHTDERRK